MTTLMLYFDTSWGDMIGYDVGALTKHILEGIRTRGVTITKITIKRLLFSRKTIVLLFFCAIPILLSLYWLTVDEEEGYLFFVNLVYVSFLLFIAGIITLLYGLSTFNDDIDDKTINYLISRPIDKVELTFYKYVGYIISSIAVVIPPIVIIFFIVSIKVGDVADNIYLLYNFISIFILAILVYGAVFMFLGLLLKHPMLISFVFLFVVESFLAAIPLAIKQITIKHYLQSIAYHIIGMGAPKGLYDEPGTTPADVTTSLIVLFVTIIIFLILTVILARNKDFP